MTTVLEAQNLTKTYMLGQVPVKALRGADFVVEQGEFVTILGPSGSGKSTLLNLIGALDRPTSGSLLIEGIDVSELSDNELAEARTKVGFVFQFFNLIPRLNAIGNVELPLVIAGVPKKERQERAREVLISVGLGDRIHHKSSELSGGERQRVAVARALVSNPSFLLMDEPTGNLDSVTAASLIDLIVELNEEKKVTCIMVTHDLEMAKRTKRTLRMKDGHLVADEVNGQ
ncbi:MAG: ATP-binding cassette domain-containing protein [Candidatus Lokiarchaeota archaeon]|nr:ATP-binding cassette domain-containing protein [Candidatus Lokiarchaeota archaeon]